MAARRWVGMTTDSVGIDQHDSALCYCVPVRALWIDLAGHEQSFALFADGRTVGRRLVEDHRAEEKLMPALDALLREAGWTYSDLTHVAAVTGPGGFMTLRVAVSLTNALAYALKIPSAGLHGSDVWRVRTDAADCVWLHSTKKTHAFIRGFGTLAVKWPEPVQLPIEEIASALAKDTLWTGELIPEHAAALTRARQIANHKAVADVLPDLLQAAEFKKNRTLEPWYGRGA